MSRQNLRARSKQYARVRHVSVGTKAVSVWIPRRNEGKCKTTGLVICSRHMMRLRWAGHVARMEELTREGLRERDKLGVLVVDGRTMPQH